MPPGDTTAPILQNAERVLFVRDDKTKKSTVWVEIRYNGPAAGFGWVLPLPKVPKVGVGTSYLFDRLHVATAPRFVMDSRQSEGCTSGRSSSSGGGCGSMADTAGSATSLSAPKGAAENGTDPNNLGVTVLQKDQVGPYDFVVIEGKTVDGILKWLNDNGYVTPAKAKDTLDSHVKAGNVFVAVKLGSGKGVEEIKPISLEMDDAEACVPLRLTAIAAVEDTDVQVFIAGPARAVPKNNLHVQINPVRFDWLHGVGNYNQVMSAAIDEAAGRAFVTEFAGVLPKTIDSIDNLTGASKQEALLDYTPLDLTLVKALKGKCEIVDGLRARNFPITKETSAILDKHLGLTKDATSIIDPLFLYGAKWECPAKSAGQTIDSAPLFAQLEKEFTQPLLDMGPKVTGAPKLTRMVMRISPAEMTKDPVFAYSTTLPDVPREYKATTNPVCRKPDFTVDAFRISIPTVKGSWIVDAKTSPAPHPVTQAPFPNTAMDPRLKSAAAALVVELLDETGPAKPIHTADIGVVDAAIAGAHAGQVQLAASVVLKPADVRWKVPASDPIVNNDTAGASSNGCSLEAAVPPGGRGAARIGLLLLLAALAVGGLRLRRRS